MKSPSTSGASSGKALPTALVFLLVAALAAAIGWVVILQRELHSTADELAELRARPAPTEKLEKENEALRARAAELESKLAAARTEAAATKSSAATKPASATPANPMAAIAATMNNPAMRTMMASQQKRMLETRFADLFNQLQFTPEQRARFLEILSDGQGLLTESSLKLISGNLTPEEKAALRDQVKDIQAVMDQKVREFFGDDTKYAAYKQYNEQQAERTQVTTLKRNLAESGVAPLTAEQSAALTDMMYLERKTFPFSKPTNRDAANPLEIPTPEAMETHLREQEQLDNQIANRAASILTPEQVAGLRQAQARRLETLRSSGEMARMMMGGGQPATK